MKKFLSFVLVALSAWFSPHAEANQDYLYRALSHRIPAEDMIDLRRVLGIDGRFDGRRIEYVVIRAHAEQGTGAATLMTDNRRNGSTQRIDGVTRDLYFRPEIGADELGWEVQQLKTYLRGSIYLGGVGVKFASQGEPPFPPGPPVPRPIGETAFVNMNFIGVGQLEINRYIQIARFQGYRLGRAILSGSSGAFPPIPGEVAFCGDRGCLPSQRLNNFESSVVFYPQAEYADYYSNWIFEIRGNLNIRTISLEFSR